MRQTRARSPCSNWERRSLELRPASARGRPISPIALPGQVRPLSEPAQNIEVLWPSGWAGYAAARGLTACDDGAGFIGLLSLARRCAPSISTRARMARMARMMRMVSMAAVGRSSDRFVLRHDGGKMPPLQGTSRAKCGSFRVARYCPRRRTKPAIPVAVLRPHRQRGERALSKPCFTSGL
jgi:hypothetical protein